MLHRDRSVWGDDVEEFDPDRFRPERFKSVPPNAYRPFGTGMRACIGRQFALQEATLVLGLVLQRFEFIDHRNYQLHTKSTLTVKPADFWIKLRPRTDHAAAGDDPGAQPPAAATPAPESRRRPAATGHGTPLLVLFGSNLGTAEGIANRLGREGVERGYQVTVAALDDHGTELPTQGAVLIVCSSYNGEPPENATAFVAGLGAASTACRRLRRRVVHRLRMRRHRLGRNVSGGSQGAGQRARAAVARPGSIRAARATRTAISTISTGRGTPTCGPTSAPRCELPTESTEQAPTGPRLSISIVNRQLTNPVVLSYEATPALVTRNVELTANGTAGTRSTRHVEVALPAGMQYRAGDHLGVLPRNSLVLIRRVMRHFKLDAGMYLTIAATSGAHTHLPIDEPAPLLGILGSCVELQAVCHPRRHRRPRRPHRRPRAARASCSALTGDDDESQARYRSTVRDAGSVGARSARTVSVVPAAVPGLPRPAAGARSAVLLDLVVAAGQPAHRAASPRACCSAPARCGVGDFDGVCSTYLQAMEPGSTVFVFTRQPTIPFRPPADPSVPMIMVGAGTGLAPFRGFLQERAEQKAGGADPGPVAAVLRLPHRGRPALCRRAGRRSSSRRMCRCTRRSPANRPTGGSTRNTNCSPTRTRPGT